jgi:single-stranded DNA-binding protein
MLSDATIVLIGHIGAEPRTMEVRGRRVIRFSVALNRKANDPTMTRWFAVESWSPPRDLVPRLRPGAYVRVTGLLFPETYKDDVGVEHEGWVVKFPTIMVLDSGTKRKRSVKATPVDDTDVF